MGNREVTDIIKDYLQCNFPRAWLVNELIEHGHKHVLPPKDIQEHAVADLKRKADAAVAAYTKATGNRWPGHVGMGTSATPFDRGTTGCGQGCGRTDDCERRGH